MIQVKQPKSSHGFLSMEDGTEQENLLRLRRNKEEEKETAKSYIQLLLEKLYNG